MKKFKKMFVVLGLISVLSCASANAAPAPPPGHGPHPEVKQTMKYPGHNRVRPMHKPPHSYSQLNYRHPAHQKEHYYYSNAAGAATGGIIGGLIGGLIGVAIGATI